MILLLFEFKIEANIELSGVHRLELEEIVVKIFWSVVGRVVERKYFGRR